MIVGSDLDLVTIMFGWLFYDRLWDIFTGTGIAFVPFLWILIDNVTESYGYGATEGPVTSLRRMDIDLAMAMTVVVLAAQPVVPLSASTPSYVVSTAASPTATAGKTGFSGVPASVDVPIWWYGVISLSYGIGEAGKKIFPTVVDLRGLEQLGRNAAIKDPVLRQETNDFFTQCYIPAQSKFVKEKPNVSSILSSYGNDDPFWIGSHVYLSTPGYYGESRAAQQIQGWPYAPLRDTEYANTVPPPTWGKPTCSEWWTGLGASTGIGLKQKLVNEAGPLDIGVTAVTGGFSAVKRQDAVVKAVLTGSPPSFIADEYAEGNMAASNGWAQTLEGLLKDVAGFIGVLIASILQGVITHIALQGLPQAYAVILMCIYALLPPVLVISRYRLEVMIVGAMGIFTVIFSSTFLWAFAKWTDQHLIAQLYPDTQTFLQFLSTYGNQAGSASLLTKRIVLDLITTSLYFGLPLLWIAVMAWSGLKVVSAVGQATDALMVDTKGAGAKGLPHKLRR